MYLVLFILNVKHNQSFFLERGWMSDKAVVLPTKVLVPFSTCDKVFLAAAAAASKRHNPHSAQLAQKEGKKSEENKNKSESWEGVAYFLSDYSQLQSASTFVPSVLYYAQEHVKSLSLSLSPTLPC